MERLSNHYTPYEGYDLLIKTFENTVNGTVKATFQDGTRLAEVREEAVRPKVGLTFLPGADTPQLQPNGRDADDPNYSRSERCFVEGQYRRGPSCQLFGASRHDNILLRQYRSCRQCDTQAPEWRRRAVQRANYEFKSTCIRRAADRLVTIDSNNVKIVNDLNWEIWDLDGLLVEVDQSSLMSLISNYQRLIRRGGPDLPTTETVRGPHSTK